MRIGGFQPSSLVDYPGTVSAIIFTIGCNFRCPYCHNPELVWETPERVIPEEEVLALLRKRRGKLPAVTVTGGEPTMQKDLIPFLGELKAMGFRVKLDTNGTDPTMLREAVEKGVVDYVAMDIKAPRRKYSAVVGAAVNDGAVAESVSYLLEGRVSYEFRTTVLKNLLAPQDLQAIFREIAGASAYFLQQFVPAKTLHPSFRHALAYSDEELREFAKEAREYVKRCEVRA